MADHDTHDHTGVPGVGGEQPVDTTDSPEFAAVNVGHPTDTTITRVSAGNLAVEGNALYRAGGTDVPVADGGTGASTASAAATNLGLGTGDSPEFAAVNLGHASDTTLTRVSAGVVAIEGTNIVKAGAATGSGLTMATARLLGRTTASAGAIEEITVGSGLSLAAGALTATGSGSTVDIEDEGSPEGSADTIDFTGAGVSVSFAGGTATVDIPGGGGGTHSYLGYNTVGASTEVPSLGRIYMKQIVVPSDGILLGLDMYLDHTSDSVAGEPSIALWTEAGGVPDVLIYQHYNETGDTLYLGDSTSVWPARWIGFQTYGKFLTAGNYWVGWRFADNGTTTRMYYDSGSDRYMSSGANWFSNGARYSQTDSTRKYSVRVSFLAL